MEIEITTLSEERWEETGEDRIRIDIDGTTWFQVLYGEVTGIYDIESMLNKAYEAGKNNEPFNIIHKEY